jgi:hypothetical protein
MNRCIEISERTKELLDICMKKGFNFDFDSEEYRNYDEVIMKLFEIADSEGYLLFNLDGEND